MNHKRGRPKNRRAGCLYCKPHKQNGFSRVEREPTQTQRARLTGIEAASDIAEHAEMVAEMRRQDDIETMAFLAGDVGEG